MPPKKDPSARRCECADHKTCQEMVKHWCSLTREDGTRHKFAGYTTLPPPPQTSKDNPNTERNSPYYKKNQERRKVYLKHLIDSEDLPDHRKPKRNKTGFSPRFVALHHFPNEVIEEAGLKVLEVDSEMATSLGLSESERVTFQEEGAPPKYFVAPNYDWGTRLEEYKASLEGNPEKALVGEQKRDPVSEWFVDGCDVSLMSDEDIHSCVHSFAGSAAQQPSRTVFDPQANKLPTALGTEPRGALNEGHKAGLSGDRMDWSQTRSEGRGSASSDFVLVNNSSTPGEPKGINDLTDQQDQSSASLVPPAVKPEAEERKLIDSLCEEIKKRDVKGFAKKHLELQKRVARLAALELQNKRFRKGLKDDTSSSSSITFSDSEELFGESLQPAKKAPPGEVETLGREPNPFRSKKRDSIAEEVVVEEDEQVSVSKGEAKTAGMPSDDFIHAALVDMNRESPNMFLWARVHPRLVTGPVLAWLRKKILGDTFEFHWTSTDHITMLRTIHQTEREMGTAFILQEYLHVPFVTTSQGRDIRMMLREWLGDAATGDDIVALYSSVRHNKYNRKQMGTFKNIDGLIDPEDDEWNLLEAKMLFVVPLARLICCGYLDLSAGDVHVMLCFGRGLEDANVEVADKPVVFRASLGGDGDDVFSGGSGVEMNVSDGPVLFATPDCLVLCSSQELDEDDVEVVAAISQIKKRKIRPGEMEGIILGYHLKYATQAKVQNTLFDVVAWPARTSHVLGIPKLPPPSEELPTTRDLVTSLTLQNKWYHETARPHCSSFPLVQHQVVTMRNW